MKWYIIEWFGWHKIECEECHHYAVVKPTDRLPKGMEFEEQLYAYAYDMMRGHMKDYPLAHCITCVEESKIKSKISEDRSYSGKIAGLLSTIQSLKESNDAWKDAWYLQREIIGNMWWHHEAIDNDEKRSYYQNNLNRLAASAKE